MSEAFVQPVGGKDIELQLRWSDEDKLGHVNNARIITLMEEGRFRWSREDQDPRRFPYGVVVAALNVNYLKPLYYEPNIRMRVGIARIGTKSYTVRHIAYQNGQPAFDGSTVMVPLAEDGVSSRALNQAEREWMTGQLLS
ncbi:acyl-CoA thioesterase [Glutamicibacter uratoxydans]|uniref:acyl-CoA thioesterase n=1 Tax=Glutamicibacter uratoxydans TaxID=43667 RepID=UPI003D6FEB1A